MHKHYAALASATCLMMMDASHQAFAQIDTANALYVSMACGNNRNDGSKEIYGSYAPDFSARDVLKHRTMVQPSPESNGTQNGQGTMQSSATMFANRYPWEEALKFFGAQKIKT
jgi:hypothetical protein